MIIGEGIEIGAGITVSSDVPAMPPLITAGLQVNLFTAPISGTTWTDASGNGRNATLQGTPTYVANNGGGIRLNNASFTGTDHISVPYNLTSTTATIEIVASFNPTSFWGTIWGNEVYNTNAGYLAYLGGSTNLSWGKGNGGTAVTITASDAIRHWAFVINSTTYMVYINGSQVGSTGSISPAQSLFATTEFLFGARHTNAGTGATDKLNNTNAALRPVFYQMRIYNTALSGSDVTFNYNAVRGAYGI